MPRQKDFKRLVRARMKKTGEAYTAARAQIARIAVMTLFDARYNARVRKRWLNGATVKVRTATAPKSIRFDWADGTIIAIGFLAKGGSKSTVAFSHTKLPDRETADRLKTEWSRRLDALGEVLITRA